MVSVLDMETEVLSKDFFNYLKDFEVMRSIRYQDFFTLLLLEPDEGFDNISDLKALAHILRDEFRMTDIIGRINYFCFGIILPHADIKGSFMAGERVRKRVEDYLFPERQRRTISLGGACFPTNVTSSDNLIPLAEQMMKMARDDGGNSLCFPKEEFC